MSSVVVTLIVTKPTVVMESSNYIATLLNPTKYKVSRT